MSLQQGAVLLEKQHPSSPDIQERVNQVVKKWNDLHTASARRAKLLEEAKDILKFNEEVDAVESWIRDKVWKKPFLEIRRFEYLGNLRKISFFRNLQKVEISPQNSPFGIFGKFAEYFRFIPKIAKIMIIYLKLVMFEVF